VERWIGRSADDALERAASIEKGLLDPPEAAP